MKLMHKRVLVTGSSRGIGKAIAFRLAKEGAEVIIHYHTNKEEATEAAEAIKKAGGKSHVLQADLMQTSEAVNLANDAWNLLGGIDILINNAGVSFKKSFLNTSVEDLDLLTQVNFKSVFFLTQAVAKKMIDHKIDGSIYTITSVNAIKPGLGFSAYGASKGALESLMKGVALELAQFGIKVNTLALGAIKTDINSVVWQDEEALRKVEERIPLGRIGKPEEVASVVCDLLVSGSYMTGTTITIDGGWVL